MPNVRFPFEIGGMMMSKLILNDNMIALIQSKVKYIESVDLNGTIPFEDPVYSDFYNKFIALDE